MELISKNRIKIRVVGCHVVRLEVIGNLKEFRALCVNPRQIRELGREFWQRYCAFKSVQGTMSIM